MGSQQKIRSLRSLFGGFKRTDFDSWGHFFRSAFFGWIFFILLVTAISLILSFYVDYLPPNIKVGRIAPKDIKADQNYEIVDERATELNRQEAFNSIGAVYDYDENVLKDIHRRIDAAFENSGEAERRGSSAEEIQEIFKDYLGVQISKDLIKHLMGSGFSVAVRERLKDLMYQTITQGIVPNHSAYAEDHEKGMTLRYIQRGSSEGESYFQDLSQVKTIQQAQDALLAKSKSLSKVGVSGVPIRVIYEMAMGLIEPNITFNKTETELRRSRAVDNIRNVIIKVQGGESIIRSGDHYEPHHLTILEGIRQQRIQTSFGIKFIGTALFILMLLLIMYVFAKRFIRKFNPSRDDLFFLGGVIVLLLLTVRLGAGLSSALRDFFPYNVSIQALYYAIPVAAGAMLTRYVLNSEVALVFAIVASSLTGVFLASDLDLSIYYLVSSIVAASSIAHVDRRSTVLKAGVIVGVANALFILAIKLITVLSVTDIFSAPDLLISMSLGFLGGILSAIFVTAAAPVAEMIFDYVTDIKLLELGNINHPLLKEMIVKAPGTYHHSQLVAVLAEAAADEVGANPLLARVGSYFHDIGKLSKVSYFIENQQNEENRHDKLNPSMSALIIASHVKDGLDMAKEHKLPRRISAFIPQHQGTKLIAYFYNKALEQAKGRDVKVDEKDYRYPGPRPQTRETGIVLLADGVEAAVRSLPEKTPQKIRAVVQKIINENFTEGQLDECDMTLKDLHLINECFVRVLVGIYHQRIEYPELEVRKPAVVTPLKGLAR